MRRSPSGLPGAATSCQRGRCVHSSPGSKLRHTSAAIPNQLAATTMSGWGVRMMELGPGIWISRILGFGLWLAGRQAAIDLRPTFSPTHPLRRCMHGTKDATPLAMDGVMATTRYYYCCCYACRTRPSVVGCARWTGPEGCTYKWLPDVGVHSVTVLPRPSISRRSRKLQYRVHRTEVHA